MYLDFFDTIELCEENRDIYDYTKKQGFLDFEVADMLEMTVDEYRFWLSEPIDDYGKRRIARAVDALIRNFRSRHSQFWMDKPRYYTQQEQRKHDLAKYGKTSKCFLNDGRKYTGQNRDYYSGMNQ